ncbi:hypothetical protein RYX36_002941 [Vicia faba]
MGRNKIFEKLSEMNLRPAAADETGEGLPYAPENWPEPGDTWGWKSGKRLQTNGLCFQDRYLYLPLRLSQTENGGSKRKQRHIFASKLSVERFIKTTFPDADVNKFFASFTWRIPAAQPSTNGGNVVPIAAVPLQQIPQAVGEYDSDEGRADILKCRAGNQMCDSLNFGVAIKYSPPMSCDICCSESGFCRACSCILCCKTVSTAHGGYSYIKCPVNAGAGICGHVAHLECALRSSLAGTVGKSIGLDAEYHCRRCDGRTDLVSHVERFVQICKSITVDLDDEIKKKVLDLGACLLRGSTKPAAKTLLNSVELAISKLKCVTNGETMKKKRKRDDSPMAHSEGLPHRGIDPMEVTMNEIHSDARLREEFNDYHSRSSKLDAEIDDILVGLRNSQELEYMVAKEKLKAQKLNLKNLYEQLDSVVSELECPNLTQSEPLYRSIRELKEQIRREIVKFEDMKKVASGFGMTPKNILKEHFGLQMAD